MKSHENKSEEWRFTFGKERLDKNHKIGSIGHRNSYNQIHFGQVKIGRDEVSICPLSIKDPTTEM